MASGTYSVAVNVGGVSINKSITRTADSQTSWEVTLPAGKDVTAWVKTDANTAACNLPSGHGYSNGNFDVYWIVSGVTYRRYGVPGTISTNALSLDGGDGTDFPASATTGIVVTKQVSVSTAIDGDVAKLFAISLELESPSATTGGNVVFEDAANDDIFAFQLAANTPVVYDLESGITNPITGDPITECLASNGSSTASATLKILVVQDSTP